MAKNTCYSSEDVGPFEQTLFLGSSVMSFTTTLGWNGSVSTLTVELVTDTCPGRKIYYDQNLNRQLWTDSDPGFFGVTPIPFSSPNEVIDITGLPVYFRLGNFEFSGIIQSWEEFHNTSGNPTYSVQITDPRELLEHSELILSSYAGTCQYLYNLFNIFGYAETLGKEHKESYLKYSVDGQTHTYLPGNEPPDGATFGSEGQIYGGAEVNNNGMQWYLILKCINKLINSIPRFDETIYSPYGRICFKGSRYGGFGLIVGRQRYDDSLKYMTEYLLDLSDMPSPPTDWRCEDSTINILALINKLCDDAGHNYYIELLPTKSYSMVDKNDTETIQSDIPIYNVIKIRTVDRSTTPNPNVFKNLFIPESKRLDFSTGYELRNETTNAMVIGGKKETLYQADNSGCFPKSPSTDYNTLQIYPYIGIDWETKNAIIPTIETPGVGTNYPHWAVGDWKFVIPNVEQFNKCLQDPSPSSNSSLVVQPLQPNTVLYESELMAAIAGFDVWYTFVTNDIFKTDTGKCLGRKGILDAFFISVADEVTKASDEFINYTRPLFATDVIDRDLNNRILDDKGTRQRNRYFEDAKNLHSWVSNYAEKFGKTFQVRATSVLSHENSDSSQVFNSEDPVQTSWTDQDYVLGLHRSETPSFDLLRTEDNKFDSFLMFEDKQNGTSYPDIKIKDTSKLPQDSYFVVPKTGEETWEMDKIFVRASVEPSYVYVNYAQKSGALAVLSIPDRISYITGDASSQNKRGLRVITDKAIIHSEAGGGIRAKFREAVEWLYKTLTQNTVGNKSLNLYHPYPFDTYPSGAAFGMRSNLLHYGPWTSYVDVFNVTDKDNQLLPGGVKLITDDRLVPWEWETTYGINLMSGIAQKIADDAVTKTQAVEKGNIKVLGYPHLSLGAEIGATGITAYSYAERLFEDRSIRTGMVTFVSGFIPFTDVVTGYYLTLNTGIVPRTWSGIYGPNITSMSVSANAQGIVTNYGLRTYTQKFGMYNKTIVDQAKFKVGEAKKTRQNTLDVKKIEQVKLENKQNRGEGRFTAARLDMTTSAFTPHEILIGMTHDYARSGVGVSGHNYKLSQMTTQSAYDLYHEVDGDTKTISDKSYMSLDGILRPISQTAWYDVAKIKDSNTSTLYRSPDAIPPMSTGSNLDNTGLYSVTVYNNYLNPLLNPGSPGALRSSGTGIGHDILCIARGGTNKEFNIPTLTGDYDYRDDYRPVALKGPLLLTSWGYNIDGKPVPNENVTTQQADTFSSGWLSRSDTWKTGPVDLRWDDARGVWTAPTSYTLVSARLNMDLAPNQTGTAKLWNNELNPNGDKIYDKNGNIIDTNILAPETFYDDDAWGYSNKLPTLPVYNRYPYLLESGTNVLLSYNTRWNKNCYTIVDNDRMISALVFLPSGMNYNSEGASGNLISMNAGLTYSTMSTGQPIYVVNNAFPYNSVGGNFGPVLSGGYVHVNAIYRTHNLYWGGEDFTNIKHGYYKIISADRAATFINYTTKGTFSSFEPENPDDPYIRGEVDVNYSWDGQAIGGEKVEVICPKELSVFITGSGVRGVASLRPQQSTATALLYHHISFASTGKTNIVTDVQMITGSLKVFKREIMPPWMGIETSGNVFDTSTC